MSFVQITFTSQLWALTRSLSVSEGDIRNGSSERLAIIWDDHQAVWTTKCKVVNTDRWPWENPATATHHLVILAPHIQLPHNTTAHSYISITIFTIIIRYKRYPYTGCSKKNIPLRFVCNFLSNGLEFQSEILPTHLVILYAYSSLISM